MTKLLPGLLAGAIGLVTMGGCAHTTTQSPAVADQIRSSLKQAGIKNVSVAQDRDKGIVTLSGDVPDDASKSQADSIAKGLAAGEVVANEVAVVPSNAATTTKTLYTDLDKGIQSNLDAALIQTPIPGTIQHSVKNGVVTLTGTVTSEASRGQAQQVAAGVPNVQQVVNDLQVKDQKATSSN